MCDRAAPGIAEAMCLRSLEITHRAMLSRAWAGLRGRTLAVNLPGSPRAEDECFGFIRCALPHAVEILRGGECART